MKEITIIQACAISIVRAVGVTKTVSHPYGFQSNNSINLIRLHQKINVQNDVCVSC